MCCYFCVYVVLFVCLYVCVSVWHYVYVCVSLSVFVYGAVGVESASQVHGAENSAGLLGTRGEPGAARLPVGGPELVAAFLVQVGCVSNDVVLDHTGCEILSTPDCCVHSMNL